MAVFGDNLLPDLLADPGTAVALLLASHADLVFRVALELLLLRAGRREVAFPSGVVVVVGERDRDLGVGAGSAGVVSLLVLVRRGEDAEGNRDAGLKVQIGGLAGRKEGSSSPRPFVT